MGSSTRRNKIIPAGAWHAVETTWGESQRVRLITGSPSLVGTDMMRVRSIHVVAFGPRGELLLVQNKDETWTFPGGRLEGGETLAEALVREVWEEARAVVSPDFTPIAATRIEFLNRVPGRVYRVHPTFLLWVTGCITQFSDEPHHDPADGVIGRLITDAATAKTLLGPLEQAVLEAVLAGQGV